MTGAKPPWRWWLRAYAAAWATLLVLDAVWLGMIARSFYMSEMSAVLADEVQVPPAVVFYLAYPLGLVLLALPHGQAATSWRAAAARAALVGLMAYGTYNMTNWATLQDWTWRLSLVDTTWGTLASAVAGAAAWWAAARSKR